MSGLRQSGVEHETVRAPSPRRSRSSASSTPSSRRRGSRRREVELAGDARDRRARELGGRVTRAVVRALSDLSERNSIAGSTPRRRSARARRRPPSAGPDRRPRQAGSSRAPDHLESVVDAAAVSRGSRGRVVDRGVDDVGGTVATRELELLRRAVDRDDRLRAGEAAAAMTCRPDAAAADDRDALSGLHASHVANGAEAGDDAAAESAACQSGSSGGSGTAPRPRRPCARRSRRS